MENDKYIGRMLDNRYEILEVIGTGGMAVVYKARCHRLNRLVAVKILKDDNLDDEDFRRRFHAESQAVAMLSHPNIVSVYDVSTSLMADYIVMELIEGITLKQYMEKKGVLNWKETLHFAMQIAKALEHAHSKGIVHRDIKPHNVMVLKNGSVKVMDFGIARMISSGNTLTKEALGSVHYISPEQARGGRVDDRSDIYSLGVVMYEMMAGRPPYDGESPVAVAIQHINGGAALPSVLNPNIPGGLEQIIMKAMAHSVSDRYPSATRMLADMDEFRKDPTKLFDYTGLPLDAAMRVQNTNTTPAKPEGATEKLPRAEQPQLPKRRPPLTPEQRREAEKRRRQQQRANMPEDEKRNRITMIAIIVCAIVAVVAIGVVLALTLGGSPKEKMLEVPRLVGETLPANMDGFTIRKQEIYDENIPAGVVISQQPEAGVQVVENSTIVVKVSLGAETKTVTLANLVDKTQDWAMSYLQGEEIEYEIKAEHSETVAENHIIKTEPKEGAKLTKGQKVTLWVSQGKKIAFGGMPMVVNNTKDEATKILKDQGLDLKIVYDEVWDQNIPEGIVIETTPTRGERLKTGQTVTLKVSKGIERHTMIDFTGMDIAAAKAWLKDNNYKEPVVEYVESDQDKDTVVSQSLEKNKEYLITEEPITLKLSDASLVPVTKDVTINLRNSALFGECHISITRDGDVVYSGRVPKGTISVTLPKQTGVGTVEYTVIINETDGWEDTVSFTAND